MHVTYSKKTFVAAFLLLYMVILLFWSLSQSFDSSPDEKMRYVMPKYIYDNGTLPRADDPTIVDEKYGHSYAGRPVLSYLISVVCMDVVSVFDSSEWALLMAARFGSVLCGIGFAITCFLIADEMFEEERLKWAFVLMTCLWPQCAFMFTYVNCDALALFSVALIILFWIKGLKEKWSIRSCVGLGIAIGIGMQSYYNMYGFVLVSVILYFWSQINKNKKTDWKKILGHGLIIAGIVLALAGWFFVRNAILYDGDFLGNRITLEMGNKYGAYGATPSDQSYNAINRFKTVDGCVNWVLLSAKSFIGCFGYMSISLKWWMYAIYIIEIVVCLGAWILNEKEYKDNKLAISLLIASLITFALDVYYNTLDYQPQGRYLLPTLIPFTLLMIKGNAKIPRWATYPLIANVIIFLIIPFLLYN